MKITTSDQSNLILTIADLLSHAGVSRYGTVSFRNRRTLHQEVKERIGNELEAKIAEICGDLGLLDFVRFRLGRELLARPMLAKSLPILSIPGYENALQIARHLVEQIIELPHHFRIASVLPKSLSSVLLFGISNLELGSGIRIVDSKWLLERIDMSFESDRLKDSICKKTDLALLPVEKSFYFCTWHSGFAGSFAGNHSIQEHLDKLRAFQGCLLALNIMEEDFFFDAHPEYSVIVCDISKGERGSVVLTDSVDSDLQYFYTNDDASSRFVIADSDDTDEEVSVQELNVEEIADQKLGLTALSKVFTKGEYNRQLQTSCLWLFRSFVSTRQLDVILHSTIALEVLLGDRDAAEGLGLTKLLANRCAYLLGQSAEDRIVIMNDFKSIYDIRSRIVHSGLHQMDRKANEASAKARDLASRILQHELS